MKVDYESIFRKYNIDYWTEGKNVTPGWVNVQCPFCDDGSNHLGFNPKTGATSCWRCGKHHPNAALSTLLRITDEEAAKLFHKYKSKSSKSKHTQTKEEHDKPEEVTYPGNVSELSKQHRKFLKKRKFQPEWLEAMFQIMGTGPVSKLKNEKGKEINFKNRILAPIYWNRKPVSWQTRSVSDNVDLKYITCPMCYEIENHKKILYGMPFAEWNKHRNNTGIIVEGITDVWRLGGETDNVCATFGIEFTLSQVLAIKACFDNVVIVFDNEPIAQSKAEKLKTKLSNIGVAAQICNPLQEGTDPADLDDKDVSSFVKEVLA